MNFTELVKIINERKDVLQETPETFAGLSGYSMCLDPTQ